MHSSNIDAEQIAKFVGQRCGGCVWSFWGVVMGWLAGWLAAFFGV